MNTSRRTFLKALGVGAGLAIGSRLGPLGGLVARADAPVERSALLLVYLKGGYNALFASPDSFMNTSFGVTSSNVLSVGGGALRVDGTFSALPKTALDRMASVGIAHGSSAHGESRHLLWSDKTDDKACALRLAAAMGGDAATKAVACGGATLLPVEGSGEPCDFSAVGGVSMQEIFDMKSTIDALSSTTGPDRAVAARAIAAAQTMSKNRLDASPKSLASLADGMGVARATLEKSVPVYDYNGIPGAYGLTSTVVEPTISPSPNAFKSRIAAAELMIAAGTNVVTVLDDHFQWDTHNDVNGMDVRTKMANRILPPLANLMTRAGAIPNLNLVVAIVGDFARSLPNSDHANGVTASVMGKYVKPGSTGRFDGNVGLAAGTPGPQGFWAYLAKVLRVPGEPFGPNPHTALV